ncbi:hypothetical protein BV898_06020 [Hypsibius exemplaris]|uniref:Uncharacterized protein n=1 Tax=Hypsibius exemplaris TaxID=2072580 RepID=A0A1W0WXV1_HYPEX|nr:hypothetical protein BV898_06020 [Hypsibius exemplaris]
MTEYRYGWVIAAEQRFCKIEGYDESELVLNDTIQLAEDAVEETPSMPTGCNEPLYIAHTAKPSTSSFATVDSRHAATLQGVASKTNPSGLAQFLQCQFTLPQTIQLPNYSLRQIKTISVHPQ